jgi:Ni/Co efflux regulator RcnB
MVKAGVVWLSELRRPFSDSSAASWQDQPMRLATPLSAVLVTLVFSGTAHAQDRDRPKRPDAAETRREFETRPTKGLTQQPPAARRGGVLPDGLRGGVVSDYQRYRLRPPPAGYAWVRVGTGFALISLADGQVFDTVE